MCHLAICTALSIFRLIMSSQACHILALDFISLCAFFSWIFFYLLHKLFFTEPSAVGVVQPSKFRLLYLSPFTL